MNVAEEVGIIAVTLGKSENMRVTAGRKFAALWVFVTTPGTAGAQQVIDAGYEPTQQGLWEMIANDPAYPVKVGTSWSAGQRLLQIGRAEDPQTAEQEERRTRAQAERSRREVRTEAPVTEQLRVEEKCNNTDLETLVAAVKLLSTRDFERFKAWFRGYCGA